MRREILVSRFRNTRARKSIELGEIEDVARDRWRESGGGEREEGKERRVKDSAIKVCGRGQEHATFTHRVHLKVSLALPRAASAILARYDSHSSLKFARLHRD